MKYVYGFVMLMILGLGNSATQACTYNYTTGTMDCGSTHTYNQSPLYSDQELYSTGTSNGSVLYSQEESDNFNSGGLLGPSTNSIFGGSSGCSSLLC